MNSFKKSPAFGLTALMLLPELAACGDAPVSADTTVTVCTNHT